MKNFKYLIRFEAKQKEPSMIDSCIESFNEVYAYAKERMIYLDFDKVEIWQADYLVLVATIINQG